MPDAPSGSPADSSLIPAATADVIQWLRERHRKPEIGPHELFDDKMRVSYIREYARWELVDALDIVWRDQCRRLSSSNIPEPTPTKQRTPLIVRQRRMVGPES